MSRSFSRTRRFHFCLCLLVSVLLSADAAERPPAVGGKSPDVWEGVLYYRDFAYGPRKDAPGEGEGYAGPLAGHDACGRIYNSHRSGQSFDLMVDARGVRSDAPVYLNIHGGAWSCACDKDGENLRFLRRLALKGFAVVSMNYQLQTDVLTGGAETKRREKATFADMLADVDAMVSHLKREFLPGLGVRADRFAIGGSSAGAHLALLYAYDQDNPKPLGLGLRHDLRVGFAVDIVGPTDLADVGTADRRLVTLMGWLVDDDLAARQARGDVDGCRARLARHSPAHLVTQGSVPTILAYCRLKPDAETDGCVPVSAYHTMTNRLRTAGVPYAGDLRSGLRHGWLGAPYEEWLADRIGDYAARYLRAP